jgi:hypothetical protein
LDHAFSERQFQGLRTHEGTQHPVRHL